MDVDRSFVDEYEQFSTVLITYVLPRETDESVVDHARRFYPDSVTRKLRRVLKDLGVFDQYAGVRLLAPKPGPGPGDREPHPPTTISHAHTFFWLPGEVSESAFDGIGSLADADVDVLVENHLSSGVRTPAPDEGVTRDGVDHAVDRADTTALPVELGNNLPLLGAEYDARGLPKYAERWLGELRLGSDGSLDTRGVRRYWTLGTFGRRADRRKWDRRLRDGAGDAVELVAQLGSVVARGCGPPEGPEPPFLCIPF